MKILLLIIIIELGIIAWNTRGFKTGVAIDGKKFKDHMEKMRRGHFF